MKILHAINTMIVLCIAMGWSLLFSQTAELVIQSGHISTINCLEFSRDGRWAATGGSDKRLIVWDAKSALQYREFQDFSWELETVSFDSSGEYVLGTSYKQAIVYRIDNGDIWYQHKLTGTGCKGILHPNKFILAMQNTMLNIEIIDLATKRIIQTVTWCYDATYMKYSPDGRWLALGGGCGGLTILDAENGYKKVYEKSRDEVCGKSRNEVCGNVISMDFTPDSKILAYLTESHSDQGTVVFFNVKSKKEYARVLTPCRYSRQISVSKDGKSLALIGTTLCILDMKKGNLIREIADGLGTSVCWSPDGKFLAAAWKERYKASSKFKLFAFDMHDASDLGNIAYSFESYALRVSACTVNPADDMIAFSFYDGVAHTLNLKTGRHKGRNLSPHDLFLATSVNFSPNGNMLGYGARIGKAKIVESSTIRELKETDISNAYYNMFLFTSDNRFVFGCGGFAWAHSFLAKWSTKDFSSVFSLSLDSVIEFDADRMALSPDNKTLVIINRAGQMCLYDANDGKLIRSTEKGPSDVSKHWDRGICYSPDGKKIFAATSKEYIHIYNSQTLVREPDSLKISHASEINFSPDGNLMAVWRLNDSSGYQICIYDVRQSYKLLKTIKATSIIYSSSPSSFGWSLTGNFMVSVSEGSKFEFLNTNTGETIATYIGTGPNDFVIVTPDHYYMTSKRGGKGVGFRIGNKILPYDQFDLKFNRPDIVLGRLGHASHDMIAALKRAWEKRVAKLNFSADQLSGDIHLPEMTINTASIPNSTRDTVLAIEIRATDSKYKLDRIVVYDNDVAIFGKKGIDLKSKNASNITMPLSLKLQKGRNKISVSVFNEHGSESIREILHVYCTAEKQPSDLYLVAIGVSDYADDGYDLKYAAKDAGDLADLIGSVKDHHRKVNVLRILDKDATRENILKSRDFLMQSKVDDDVIVFYAGHGLLDERLDYYLATHDIDFNVPAGKGLAYEDFESLLDGIPSRHKLMLMDACHSGEVDKEENVLAASNQENRGAVKTRAFKTKTVVKTSFGLNNSFDLMQQMFADVNKGTGAMIISSAGGAEYAFESETWNNGVFTYCILEGLKTRNADADHDGKIRVSELRDYVTDKVQALTDGKQRPTSRKENLEDDFRVW